MPRKRSYASQEKQSVIREEIRTFGPVNYMVNILQKPSWVEMTEIEDDEGSVIKRPMDRTPEYTAKLKFAGCLLDKVAASLRHSTKDVIHDINKPVSSYSDAELVDEVVKRRTEPAGKGTTTSH